MKYKYLNNITSTKGSNDNELILITIPREGIDNVSVYTDYNVETDVCNVIIRVRKLGKVVESRTILNHSFPKKLKRNREVIKIYLKPYETKNF